LASAGIFELAVKRRVKIAIISTGDELTALGQPLASGKIYDSNRYALNGLLNDANYEVTDMGVIADDKQHLEGRFITAAKTHDVMITTGGVSVGEADYVGKIGPCCFFGLPGNPVAVLVTFQYLVAPALKQLAGAQASKPLQLTATCTTALKKAPGRQDYQRGILSQDHNGEFFVTSSGKQGSNMLSSVSRANCYIILPPECTGVQAGDKVRVELIQGAEII
jgi:molybdopterin molybdotransferase